LSSITERRREEAAMSVWSNRFLKSAIVQGSIVTGLAIIFVLGQMLYSSSALNIIQFLSLSFEGPAKWLFLGYILYIILAVAIATTALFYNHFEVNMQIVNGHYPFVCLRLFPSSEPCHSTAAWIFGIAEGGYEIH
jgi:hypothetical protein